MGKVFIAVFLTLMASYIGMTVGVNMNLPEVGSISAITVMGACIIFYNDQKNNF